MSSFWWKEIQLIVNAWLCLEARWIHSKDLAAYFEVRPGSGLADKNHRDYGIVGNFGRNGGIERPYWGPSIYVATDLELKRQRQKQISSLFYNARRFKLFFSAIHMVTTYHLLYMKKYM